MTSGHLQDIADAIREKNRGSTLYRPGDMAAAIQALEGPGYPEPTGSMEITENGTYNVKDVAEAAVNVSAGSVSLELNYDFTQSMTDTLKGLPVTSNSVTQTAEGAVMDGTGAYIRLKPRFSANTYTYEIDIASITIRSGSHNRLIMGTDEQGLIYRNSNKWAFYANSWVETNVSDPTYLNGCTVKVYVDQDGYWHIYRNGVLWFEPGLLLNLDTNYNSYISYFTIGARSQAPSSVTVTGLRVY